MLGDREQVIRMHCIRDKSELVLGLNGLFFDIKPIEANSAMSRPQNATDRAERCRFAGAVGADQPDDFSRFDCEAELVNGCEIAIVLGKTVNFDHERSGLMHDGKTSLE